MKPELGYLARDGTFHACHAWGHCDLAFDLVGQKGEAEVERRGFMTLKGDPGIDKFNWFYLASKPAFPSQRQWDFVFDWCRRKKKAFPPRFLKELWDDQQTT